MAANSRVAANFSDWHYRAIHGRKPRGRGNWGFIFVGCVAGLDGGPSQVTEFAPGCILYSDAKRWARKRALELGAGNVQTAT